MTSLPGDRLDYLDALRGLAIAGVVAVHSGQKIDDLGGAAYWTFAFGARGVQLFFAVSAFTLLAVYSTRTPKPAEFFTKRLFRIAPMFYLGVLLYAFRDGMAPRYYAPEGLDAIDFTLTAAFLHGWRLSSVNAVFLGAWSISTEWMFYLLFIPLMFWLPTLRRSVAAFAVSIAVAFFGVRLGIAPLGSIGPDPLLRDFLFFSILAQMPAFLVGFVAYRASRSQPCKNCGGIAIVLAFTICVAIVVIGEPAARHLLAIPAIGLLVYGLSQAQPAILVNAFTMHLGRVSFSVYVLHHLVLDYVAVIVPRIEGWPTLSACLLLLVTLAGSTLVATATFYAIEQPCIRLGRLLLSARMRPGLN